MLKLRRRIRDPLQSIVKKRSVCNENSLPLAGKRNREPIFKLSSLKAPQKVNQRQISRTCPDKLFWPTAQKLSMPEIKFSSHILGTSSAQVSQQLQLELLVSFHRRLSPGRFNQYPYVVQLVIIVIDWVAISSDMMCSRIFIKPPRKQLVIKISLLTLSST